MLRVIQSMSELPFDQLMAVYRESNMRSARRMWGEDDPERALSMVERMAYEDLQCGFFTIRDARLCVWVVENQCVSDLRLEPWRDGWLLAALETSPDHRNQGYAQSLLRSVQGYLAERGPVRLYSHIHSRNTPSIRVHEQCGFRKISDTAALLDGTITTQMGTYLLTYNKEYFQ